MTTNQLNHWWFTDAPRKSWPSRFIDRKIELYKRRRLSRYLARRWPIVGPVRHTSPRWGLAYQFRVTPDFHLCRRRVLLVFGHQILRTKWLDEFDGRLKNRWSLR